MLKWSRSKSCTGVCDVQSRTDTPVSRKLNSSLRSNPSSISSEPSPQSPSLVRPGHRKKHKKLRVQISDLVSVSDGSVSSISSSEPAVPFFSYKTDKASSSLPSTEVLGSPRVPNLGDPADCPSENRVNSGDAGSGHDIETPQDVRSPANNSLASVTNRVSDSHHATSENNSLDHALASVKRTESGLSEKSRKTKESPRPFHSLSTKIETVLPPAQSTELFHQWSNSFPRSGARSEVQQVTQTKYDITQLLKGCTNLTLDGIKKQALSSNKVVKKQLVNYNRNPFIRDGTVSLRS